MKITKKMMVSLLALALVFAFSGCDSSGGGDGGMGNTLSISGEQVYNPGGATVYSGPDLTVSSNVGFSGNIEDGKLTFSAGTPAYLQPLDNFLTSGGEFASFLSYFSYSPGGTQYANLQLTTSNGQLSKFAYSTSGTSATQEMVWFIYVDRDCTIARPAGTTSMSGYNVTNQDINLNLKTGWNAVAIRYTIDNTAKTGTANVSSGNSSSCKWTFGL